MAAGRTLNGLDEQWLSADEAARRLGVKLGTLYSYVSRRMITSTVAPDGRRSVFARADVEALLARRRSKPGGGPDAVVASAITRLDDTGHRYRGRPVAELARNHTFEEVAALLWGVEDTGAPWLPVPLPMPLDLPAGTTLSDRIRIAAALVGPHDQHRHDRSLASVAVSARLLVATVVHSLPSTSRAAPALVVDGRRRPGSVAAELAPRLGGSSVDGAFVRTVNLLLVLLADHELATSTLAVRVAASTWADIDSAVLAGLACAGPLHIGASREVVQLLADAARRGAYVAVGDVLRAGRRVPGFGHTIYRSGDPRFNQVYDEVLRGRYPRARVELVRDVLAAVGERVDVAPNADYAGGALVYCAGLHDDAFEAIFDIARMAGWVAHALEEYRETPLRFRVRGLYTGVRV